MSHGGKGPRIPGANTPASLSAFEAGYALIEENRRKAEAEASKSTDKRVAALKAAYEPMRPEPSNE